MTANQIAYWNLQEQRRSNLERERETQRSNLAKEKETNRSNLAREHLQGSELDETVRSNLVKEQFNISNLQESSRHNRADESIRQQQVDVSRLNLYENQRSNRVNEGINKYTAVSQNDYRAAQIELSEAEQELKRYANAIDTLESDARVDKIRNDIKIAQQQAANARYGNDIQAVGTATRTVLDAARIAAKFLGY